MATGASGETASEGREEEDVTKYYLAPRPLPPSTEVVVIDDQRKCVMCGETGDLLGAGGGRLLPQSVSLVSLGISFFFSLPFNFFSTFFQLFFNSFTLYSLHITVRLVGAC